MLCCSCWGTSHFLRLLLTTKMVSIHVHFPSTRYFVAFVCVFCVMLCVSVPCDKSLCGWSGLPYGWGYSYCGRGKSPRSCSGLPCGKGHAELCSTSDLQVHSDWVIGRLPFCLQNSSGPLFDEWGNAVSGRNNGSQSRLCTICGMFVYNPCSCMEISALHMPVDVYILRYISLQFLLHRRHHWKHRFAFARTLTLLLLLGGDVETNPGPSKQWLKNQADKKRYLLHREKILAKKDCSMQMHQNTRKKHPKLSMHPFHNEREQREQLLRQAMQLIHSQRGMLPKLHMRLTCS